MKFMLYLHFAVIVVYLFVRFVIIFLLTTVTVAVLNGQMLRSKLMYDNYVLAVPFSLELLRISL